MRSINRVKAVVQTAGRVSTGASREPGAKTRTRTVVEGPQRLFGHSHAPHRLPIQVDFLLRQDVEEIGKLAGAKLSKLRVVGNNVDGQRDSLVLVATTSAVRSQR